MARFRERLRRLHARARSARVALIRLALFGLALLALFVGLRLAGIDASVQSIEDWGEDLGTAGLIGFVPAAILLNCVFVLPVPIAAGGAGLLFGTAAGAALAILVAAGSAGIQNAIGRRGAGARAEHLLGERGRRLDDLLDRRGFAAIFYARLTPFTPFTALNYASGITKLGAWPMAIASGLAMGPRIYAYTALGGNLDDLWSEESVLPLVLLTVSTIVGLGLITHAGLRYRRGRDEPEAA
ncbi:MAG TPA: VTT domain-containing protein [Thermoleophilaceae bacterium]|jgi:uncharacterized membrane protein YdjX (TVP38/TMEM64 family)